MSNTTSTPQNILKWASNDGRFKRQTSQFRNWINKDSQFPAESGRYVLYVSLACPWAHRTLIARKLKGLENDIKVYVVNSLLGEGGWSFKQQDRPDKQDDIDFATSNHIKGATADSVLDKELLQVGDGLYQSKFLREIYLKAEPEYKDRVTVPVLWDTKLKTIVSNESSEILRMLNKEFKPSASTTTATTTTTTPTASIDLYPDHLSTEIDNINTWIYDQVNNGVYKAGFATTQQAYNEAVIPLFSALDRLEDILSKKQNKTFIVSDQLTEVDVRLYTTLIRFDTVYYNHFKTNFKTIRDGYPLLHHWLQNLYWNYSAFKSTTDFYHIKKHYFESHKQINPTGIVPVGPIPNIREL